MAEADEAVMSGAIPAATTTPTVAKMRFVFIIETPILGQPLERVADSVHVITELALPSRHDVNLTQFHRCVAE
ncbi:hypothetical protein ACFYPC_07270 [Streptomyces sp. NPDC005808]|uniref:hypothetical protein n=1 Tax=Streptomyces sp. NPDC005808 TaxID=3364734 RepID=UPI00368DCE83